MLLSDDATEDQCKELIINHMLSVFPDAIVDGAPVITSGTNTRTVRVNFTSPMFDIVAANLIGVIDNEFNSFKLWINESPGLTEEDKVAYILLVDAMASRVNAILGTKE
jgi:hypothetical protein